MATGFNTQIIDGMYHLQFETDKREYYEYVQAAARDCLDGKATDKCHRWTSVEERLPENDVPVLVSAKRKRWDGKEYRIVFTAFHTDGTTHTEDSGYGWDDCLGMRYCEETDDYIIPEAWWEDVRYGEEFSKVYDTTITHWMPLPEPPEVTKP